MRNNSEMSRSGAMQARTLLKIRVTDSALRSRNLMQAASFVVLSAALSACASQQKATATSPVVNNPPAQIQARTGGFKDDFAVLNAMREGVVSLPSGVQYEVLRTGNGHRPAASDTVRVSYTASLPNGTVFDSTEQGGPRVIKLEDIVVPGLKEALLLMDEGAHWHIVVPPSAGFGRSGNNQLRRRDLIYDIELLSIEE
jgi:FKBP-type peptidyl-prolyl cis-trans isomerase